jgi:hypothetical protein
VSLTVASKNVQDSMTAARRKRILLAELDDRLAVSLLARLYEHNRTHDVLLARSADVTQALLQAERFDVVVSHAHPSNPGVLAQLQERLPSPSDTRLVALIDAEVGASSGSLYAAGADAVHRIGTPTAALADDIVRTSLAPTLLQGRLDQVGAPELIQMLCLCRRSMMIRLSTSSERAVVWLSDGEIHHAVSETLSGKDAIGRVVRADNGSFWAVASTTLPPRSIHQDWQHVLLEAARDGDEAAQRSTRREEAAAAESAPAPHQSQVRKLGKSYRELTDLGLQSIKAGNFSKAREYWDAARAIGPEAPEPLHAGMAKALSSDEPDRSRARHEPAAGHRRTS